jgi:hypothetical protein
VSECDREALTLRRLWPTGGCRAIGKKLLPWPIIIIIIIIIIISNWIYCIELEISTTGQWSQCDLAHGWLILS